MLLRLTGARLCRHVQVAVAAQHQWADCARELAATLRRTEKAIRECDRELKNSALDPSQGNNLSMEVGCIRIHYLNYSRQHHMVHCA